MDSNINSNIKLSNVIGAPFSDYVLLQLYQRAAHNSTINRTNEDVLFLANKTGWARLVSSVNIKPVDDSTSVFGAPRSSIIGFDIFSLSKIRENFSLSKFYENLFDGQIPPGDYSTPESLAKNWILEAGCSIQNGNGINLRSGIGPDGAYGLGGTQELGYRPMPGLTGVTIETTGRLGSLRQANIQFKVWNMNQLNVVEALYFRLGYSMLLEWGHTQYFDNNSAFQSKEIYGIDDPFLPGRRKEQIQQDIARRSKKTFGNYDGMLGIVSNFNWSMNQDGGFDCTVKLVGLGSVMDSMRINQTYKLPDGLIKQYKKNKEALATQELQRIAALEAKVKALQEGNAATGPTVEAIDPVPKSPTELRARLQSYDNYQGLTVTNVQEDYGIPFYNKKDNFTPAKAQGGYDYYTSFSRITADSIKPQALKAYAGLWLNQGGQIGWARIPLDGVNGAIIDTTLLNYAIESTQITTAEGSRTLNQLGLTGGTYVSKYFDFSTKTYIIGPSGPGGSISTQNVPLTSPLNSAADEANLTIGGLNGPDGSTDSISFGIKVLPITDATDKYFQPTRQELIKLIDIWQSQSESAIYEVKVKSTGANSVLITGKFKGTPVDAAYSGPEADRVNVIKGNGGKETRLVTVTFEFSTTNPGFLSRLGAPTQPNANATSQTPQKANAGDTNGTTNTDSVAQTQAAEGFASALEAMLTVVQAATQVKLSESKAKGTAVDITDLTSKFFQDGIMNGVLNSNNIPKTAANLTEKEFLIAYASRGFNSDLMVDPSLYDIVPAVNFTKLCKAFAFAYGQGGEEGSTSILTSPTYISFGYLLAFLNNMCLIYDSPDKALSTNNNPTTGTPKRPYVYIDFNPETNFCLTSPQQLSVDPYTCLVPLQATQPQYKTIFPENIYKHWRSEKDTTPIFDPAGEFNGVSTVITTAGLSYKTPANAYQGRLMDILLNIDYLLNQVKSFASADIEHAVKLESFLQQILQDVNKALGNTNLFRVAYRDDSNTIQIQDDQWVPSLNGDATETSMLNAKSYNSKLAEKNDQQIAGLLPITSGPKELPIAGTLSLARQFQLRSVMSTKLASMIAISAQASTGSVNATDHSSLSYLNQNFQDRYKPYIQDASNGESGTNANSKNASGDSESNDQKAAELFNDHIINIYSNFNLSADRIGLAKNYYIERMSKVKSGDPVVTAAPFIPAELEMTIDGISGIIMGNAFTIPQDRLPLSLRGENGLAKIAFIVTGLTHTIQNNEWLTRIKGQMIKLREEVKQVTAASLIGEIQKQIIQPLTNGTIPTLSDSFNKANPWSAAFISYIMKQAGLSSFPASQSHTGYAQALRVNNIGFEILDPSTTVVKLGDLVIANREGNNMTFKTKTWSGYSHGDIVSSISGNTATGIGGNVSQSVATKSIGLVDGKLGKSDYFVILRPPQGSVKSILSVLGTEYNLWKTNKWKETSPGALPYLREYYKVVGIKI